MEDNQVSAQLAGRPLRLGHLRILVRLQPGQVKRPIHHPELIDVGLAEQNVRP